MRILRQCMGLTAGLVLALGACNERRSTDRTTGAIDALPGDTAPGQIAGDTAAATTEGSALTDANIVALLDEANAADSAAGAYALTKATSPDVKSFAKLMISEHHALRLQGQQLAKRLNVTPQPPANDPVAAAGKSEMEALKAAPKGPEFDRTYIAQEIAIHEAVLDLAEKALEAAQNQELRALIEQAKPILEKHRDRAEEIQKKLGRPSA